MGTAPYEPSYTIKRFCESEDFSEPTYFKLREMGLGPRELRLPGINVVRITYSDRLAWQERMHNLTGEDAERVRVLRERTRAKGRMAAAKSLESPKHVSKPTGTPRRRHRQQQGEAVR